MGTDNDDIYAKVLFDSDRVCCVCRDRARKHIQIHHIDGDHSNDAPGNLAVLCLECHADTLVKGGFSRHLSPTEVRLYRDDWLAIVGNERRTRLSEPATPPPLGFSVDTEPIQSFLKQFERQNVLPIGVSYHFSGYFFLTPGFPTIIVDADKMNSENGERHKSVIKAYLLCVLGAVAPQGMFTTTTLDPSQSINSVWVGSAQISVPRWFVVGFEELGQFHLTGEYDCYSNQILLTLAPILQVRALNYDLLGIKLEKVALALMGKQLCL